MTYKQALEYKAKEDWDNYLLCLIKSDEKESDKELLIYYQKSDWKTKINFSKILPTIEKLVDKNNPKAQNFLGYMYRTGQGVEKDYEKAIHYYTLSANQGNSVAQNNSGNMYHFGEGVEQNYEKAIHYYTLSANQGNSSAQNNLGYMYYFGEGVEQDYEKAIHYYTLSANQGYSSAQNNLEVIPEIERIKYELKQAKKENEELKTHIMAMPDGDLYFEAKKHYSTISHVKNLSQEVYQ